MRPADRGGIASHEIPLESLRAANLQTRAFARQLDTGGLEVWEFFCECGCLGLVELTVAEFDAAELDGIWIDDHADTADAGPS